VFQKHRHFQNKRELNPNPMVHNKNCEAKSSFFCDFVKMHFFKVKNARLCFTKTNIVTDKFEWFQHSKDVNIKVDRHVSDRNSWGFK
jgi:hypothetical protein